MAFGQKDASDQAGGRAGKQQTNLATGEAACRRVSKYCTVCSKEVEEEEENDAVPQ